MFKWPWLLTNHPSIHSDLIPETALQQGPTTCYLLIINITIALVAEILIKQ